MQKQCKNNCFWSFRQLDVGPWKSTKLLQKTYRNPCKIDEKSMQNRCSKQSCKKHWKWCQHGAKMEIEINQKTWKNNTKTHHEKWCKNEASKSYTPEGAHGPGVPEGVRSSSGDSRSRFPLASNILQKTNTRQTIKKQPRTSGGQLTRTWRAGRHGADLSIYWAQGPPGTGAQSAPPWRARLSVFMFSVTKSSFRSK